MRKLRGKKIDNFHSLALSFSSKTLDPTAKGRGESLKTFALKTRDFCTWALLHEIPLPGGCSFIYEQGFHRKSTISSRKAFEKEHKVVPGHFTKRINVIRTGPTVSLAMWHGLGADEGIVHLPNYSELLIHCAISQFLVAE